MSGEVVKDYPKGEQYYKPIKNLVTWHSMTDDLVFGDSSFTSNTSQGCKVVMFNFARNARIHLKITHKRRKEKETRNWLNQVTGWKWGSWSTTYEDYQFDPATEWSIRDEYTYYDRHPKKEEVLTVSIQEVEWLYSPKELMDMQAERQIKTIARLENLDQDPLYVDENGSAGPYLGPAVNAGSPEDVQYTVNERPWFENATDWAKSNLTTNKVIKGKVYTVPSILGWVAIILGGVIIVAIIFMVKKKRSKHITI